jgi:MFS family permease
MNNKMSSWLNKNVIGFGLASFFGDLCYEMTTALEPLLVSLVVGPGAAPSVLGLMNGIADGAASGMKLVSGWLSDYLNKRKPFIVIGYALTGLFSVLLGAAMSAFQLISFRTVAWFGKGMREPARDALLVESVSPAYYGRMFGLQRAMDTGGAILGPLVVFLLMGTVPVRWLFLFAILPAIAAVLSVMLLTRDVANIEVAAVPRHFFAQLRLLPGKFILFMLVMFVFGIGNFHKTLFLLRSQELLEPGSTVIAASATAILLYVIHNIARAVAEFVVGYLSDFVGRIVLLGILGFGLFGLCSVALLLPASFKLLTLIFIGAGVSAATVGALERAVAADLLPPDSRATGYGLLQTVDGIGDLVSSIVVGTLWTAVAPAAGFIYAAVLSGLAMLLLFLLRARI